MMLLNTNSFKLMYVLCMFHLSRKEMVVFMWYFDERMSQTAKKGHNNTPYSVKYVAWQEKPGDDKPNQRERNFIKHQNGTMWCEEALRQTHSRQTLLYSISRWHFLDRCLAATSHAKEPFLFLMNKNALLKACIYPLWMLQPKKWN